MHHQSQEKANCGRGKIACLWCSFIYCAYCQLALSPSSIPVFSLSLSLSLSLTHIHTVLYLC